MMANADSVDRLLKKVNQADDLQRIIVVGKDSQGKTRLFVPDADMERLVVLLERAKSQLIKNMDG